MKRNPLLLGACALAIGLGLGYFIGREHFRYQLSNAFAGAFSGISEEFSDAFGNATDNQDGSFAPAGLTESQPTEPTVSEQAREQYAANSVLLYEITSSYREDFLDGRVPAVFGKVQNKGDRTLERVEVTAYFLDDSGTVIFEKSYHPVLVTNYSFTGDEGPLKPNYIREFGFKAKEVPSEWAEGSVQVAVTNIEFMEITQ